MKRYYWLALALLCAIGVAALSYSNMNAVHLFNSLIDSTVIGGTTPAAATVTTLSANTSVTTPAATITALSAGTVSAATSVTSPVLISSGAGVSSVQLGTNGSAQIVPITTYKDITMVLDGGGSPITTGWKGTLEVPFACTLQGWTLLSIDLSGSIALDVQATSYSLFPTSGSIVNGHYPVISSAYKSQDFNIAAEGWSTSVAQNTLISFYVLSATTLQHATMALRCSVP